MSELSLRPSRPRTFNAAKFAIMIALVAAALVLTGCNTEVHDQAATDVEAEVAQSQLQGQEAGDEIEPLSLSLSLSVSQQICETERANEFSLADEYQDDDGNWVERRVVFGWWGIPSVPVRWQVSGGQEPYTLVIDHESADRDGDYEGASGTAQVGCADASVGTSFWPEEGRLYDVDPEVDSGWKTVRAVVTDANGDTAEATVDFYVIRTDADLLRRGQTYRVWNDHLVTAPSAHDVALASPSEIECPENAPNDYRCEPSFGFLLLPDGHQDDWTTAIAQVNLYVTDGTEESRWRKLDDGTWIEVTAAVQAASDANDPILAALDEIANSVGDPPRSR